ncbi:hypothetical protein [Parabacteroides bouchesdurhonensis]|uniref:hypothetical protein n=1 Tax=Parabacteroides bouchesdurhonensis TaxID=1936995 RepID=UPI001F301037|nr:hypothetical protein [Parabacteroides bouchesdurhonensis]
MEKRTMVTINGNGTVSVPDKVMMQDFEIADLFGVMIPAIRSNVRAILKSEVVITDTQHGGTVIGTTILPDYYGLDMIMALAFRIHSRNAGILRKWILRKVTARSECSDIPLYISFNCNQSPN